jgi:DNA-directed RNA polymerase I, II, and III subunit RPABC1
MDETYRLWRVRKTVLQMLRDRGYISQPEEIDMTLQVFKEKYSENVSGGSGSNRYREVS